MAISLLLVRIDANSPVGMHFLFKNIFVIEIWARGGYFGYPWFKPLKDLEKFMI